MARRGSGNVAFLLIDGISILGATTDITDSREDLLEENTPLGVNWETWVPLNIGRATFEQNGFYDSEADSANGALIDNSGAARVLSYGYEGNTVGQSFIGAAGALRGKYSRSASNKGLTKATGGFTVSGHTAEGKILAPLAARTAAGDTTATYVDGYGEPNTGYAYLQTSALALGGYDDCTITVQDSADHISWATRGTFSAVTAVGAERITIAGTIGRYTSITWAWTGSGTGQSITFMAGLIRN